MGNQEAQGSNDFAVPSQPSKTVAVRMHTDMTKISKHLDLYSFNTCMLTNNTNKRMAFKFRVLSLYHKRGTITNRQLIA